MQSIERNKSYISEVAKLLPTHDALAEERRVSRLEDEIDDHLRDLLQSLKISWNPMIKELLFQFRQRLLLIFNRAISTQSELRTAEHRLEKRMDFLMKQLKSREEEVEKSKGTLLREVLRLKEDIYQKQSKVKDLMIKQHNLEDPAQGERQKKGWHRPLPTTTPDATITSRQMNIELRAIVDSVSNTAVQSTESVDSVQESDSLRNSAVANRHAIQRVKQESEQRYQQKVFRLQQTHKQDVQGKEILITQLKKKLKETENEGKLRMAETLQNIRHQSSKAKEDRDRVDQLNLKQKLITSEQSLMQHHDQLSAATNTLEIINKRLTDSDEQCSCLRVSLKVFFFKLQFLAFFYHTKKKKKKKKKQESEYQLEQSHNKITKLNREAAKLKASRISKEKEGVQNSQHSETFSASISNNQLGSSEETGVSTQIGDTVETLQLEIQSLTAKYIAATGCISDLKSEIQNSVPTDSDSRKRRSLSKANILATARLLERETCATVLQNEEKRVLLYRSSFIQQLSKAMSRIRTLEYELSEATRYQSNEAQPPTSVNSTDVDSKTATHIKIKQSDSANKPPKLLSQPIANARIEALSQELTRCLSEIELLKKKKEISHQRSVISETDKNNEELASYMFQMESELSENKNRVRQSASVQQFRAKYAKASLILATPLLKSNISKSFDSAGESLIVSPTEIDHRSCSISSQKTAPVTIIDSNPTTSPIPTNRMQSFSPETSFFERTNSSELGPRATLQPSVSPTGGNKPFRKQSERSPSYVSIATVDTVELLNENSKEFHVSDVRVSLSQNETIESQGNIMSVEDPGLSHSIAFTEHTTHAEEPKNVLSDDHTEEDLRKLLQSSASITEKTNIQRALQALKVRELETCRRRLLHKVTYLEDYNPTEELSTSHFHIPQSVLRTAVNAIYSHPHSHGQLHYHNEPFVGILPTCEGRISVGGGLIIRTPEQQETVQGFLTALPSITRSTRVYYPTSILKPVKSMSTQTVWSDSDTGSDGSQGKRDRRKKKIATKHIILNYVRSLAGTKHSQAVEAKRRLNVAKKLHQVTPSPTPPPATPTPPPARYYRKNVVRSPKENCGIDQITTKKSYATKSLKCANNPYAQSRLKKSHQVSASASAEVHEERIQLADETLLPMTKLMFPAPSPSPDCYIRNIQSALSGTITDCDITPEVPSLSTPTPSYLDLPPFAKCSPSPQPVPMQ